MSDLHRWKAALAATSSLLLFMPLCISRAATPIDGLAAYYLTSQLGTGILPDFRGGTLRVDDADPIYTKVYTPDFTVGNFAGNTIDAYGGSSKFKGVFSGPGGITFTDSVGGGLVRLTGANIYTGGTLIKPGASLALGNQDVLPIYGSIGSLVGNVIDNGRFIIENSYWEWDYTYIPPSVGPTPRRKYTQVPTIIGGNISGSGILEVSGHNTLVLTGANTYTGGTVIDQGSTLQLGNGGTTGSIVGNVQNSGTLAFNRSDTVTFADDITGGALKQIGAGTLILTGNNTGTTEVAPGARLEVGDGGATGSITGNVTNGGTIEFRRSGTYASLGSWVSGPGAILIGGGGTLQLSGTIASTGGLGILPGSTLQVGSQGSMQNNVANDGAIIFGDNINAAAISGNGSVTVTGDTTFVGENTYRGGTTILPGATLRVGIGNTEGSIAGNVTDNGALIFNRHDSVSITGVISGSGMLRQSGSGSLVLTGANTYTGSTIIDTGSTLNIGGSSPVGSIIGNIINNGTLMISKSVQILALPPGCSFGCVYLTERGTTRLDGIISGTGEVIIQGSRPTAFTGENTYTGGTTILSSSQLYIGYNGTSGSIIGDVLSDGILTFSRTDSLTYNGVISGSGRVEVAHGRITLNGVQKYTGPTVVYGTLIVGDEGHPGATIPGDVSVYMGGGTLAGHGKVLGSVQNTGGSVAPGSSLGTLTIGSYTQDYNSDLTINVSPGGSSSLAVNGPAFIDGWLKLEFAPGNYRTRANQFLTASNITGTFAATLVNGEHAYVDYPFVNGLPHDVFYSLHESNRAFTIIVHSTKDGQLYSDVVTSAIDAGHRLSAMILDRGHISPCGTAADDDQSCGKLSIWGYGFGGTGSVDDQSGGASNFNTRWAGIVTGIDYRLDQGVLLGLALSYDQRALAVSDAMGRALSNAFSVALDAAIPLYGARLDASVIYTSDSTNSSRDLDDIGTASARFNGYQIGWGVQLAYPVLDGNLLPMTRLSFVHDFRGAASETGIDWASLAVDEDSYSSLRWDVGLRYKHDYALESGMVLTPHVSAGVQTELISTTREATIRPVDVAGFTYLAPYARPERNALLVGTGLSLRAGSMSFSIKGDGRLSGHQREITLKVQSNVQL